MKDFEIEKGNFSIIHNNIYRSEVDGKKLSMEAWGLYGFMISLPDSWDYTIMGLTKVVNAGKNKIQRILKELESAGYLIREQTHNGRFGKMKYTILLTPKIQYPQNQHTEIQATDFEPQLSTKELSTKEQTDKLKIKGENHPTELHFLTKELIDKKYISILDYELDKFNNLFKELDNRYNYKNVLATTRYILNTTKEYENIDKKYLYFEKSILNNLNMLKNNTDNRPEFVKDFINELTI